jgi:DNA mismatch endonuclease (patch repair protein)
MSRIRTENTYPEIVLRSLVHRMGFRFRLHRKDLPGKPDLVFPSIRRVIFVHGCFWHGHACRRGKLPESNVAFWSDKITANRRRDKRVCKSLKALGWRPLAIWECQLRDESKVTKIIGRFMAN